MVPAIAAGFVEIELDIETGKIEIVIISASLIVGPCSIRRVLPRK